MRDLTKSLFSFSWVMPLFGAKQAANLALPEDWSRPTEKATQAFEAVGSAAQDQLGPWLKQAFDVGDRLQRGTVDLMFGAVDLSAFDPRSWMRSAEKPAESAPPRRTQTASPPPGPGTGPSARHRAEEPPAKSTGSGRGGWGPVSS